MRALIENTLLAQRGGMIGWVPVCLAVGIGGYFSLDTEPDALAMIALAVIAVILLLIARFVPLAYAPLLMALVLAGAGCGVAKYRAETMAAPVLGFRYYGPIAGRVVKIDRSASDAIRLTLDQVVLDRLAPDRTPARVRVSLHGDQPLARYDPGDRVILTGHLSPPSGPAEPGGFDFQRHAWFLQLGAVGYTRTPVLRASVPDRHSIAMRIFAARMALSHAVQTAMPGEPGAFAAAIMTGDRSGMGQDTLDDLRASNLAHLLAISGLHMGLLTGFIFTVLRSVLSILPGIALRWPVKKIAAVAAILVGAFYLALSGGNVATERAFIMVSVMFVAILLGRRALTLRAVAIAAVIVLLWQPEALVGPGFQMSFAATTALVAVFAALRRYDLTGLPKWARPVLSVFMSSFVAGLATAPIAAAHFNQIAHYGLIANLLSVPLMGVLVMPAAVLAICLAPLGLWQIGLWVMEGGLRWILFVASSVAQQDGALSHVIAPQGMVLPAISLGFLWMILVQGRIRLAGVIPVFLGSLLWHQTTRPDLLVADNGALIGLQTASGRALSKPKGSGFVAGIWLENDGAPVPQAVAAERAGLSRSGRVVMANLEGWRILQVSGKTALADITGCSGADVLISNQTDAGPRPCRVYDITALRDTGALAFDITEEGDLTITSASSLAGARPWNSMQGPAHPIVTLSRRSQAAGSPTSVAQVDQ